MELDLEYKKKLIRYYIEFNKTYLFKELFMKDPDFYLNNSLKILEYIVYYNNNTLFDFIIEKYSFFKLNNLNNKNIILYCLNNNNIYFLKTLIKKGLNIVFNNSFLETKVIENNNFDFFAILYDSYFNKPKNLLTCIKNNKYKIFKILLKNLNLIYNINNNYCNVILINAIIYSNLKIIKLLIKYKYNINIINYNNILKIYENRIINNSDIEIFILLINNSYENLNDLNLLNKVLCFFLYNKENNTEFLDYLMSYAYTKLDNMKIVFNSYFDKFRINTPINSNSRLLYNNYQIIKKELNKKYLLKMY